MKQTDQRLRKFLELTRTEWDRPTTRPAVRENFQRVCDCRTPVLGGEVYASASEEKVFITLASPGVVRPAGIAARNSGNESNGVRFQTYPLLGSF